MIRLLASIALELLANAVGLGVAATVLDGLSIDVTSFVIVVGIYTLLKFIGGPLMVSMSIKYFPAFRGGIALLTTFAGLAITALLSDGLSITGLDTWLLATLIVWLFGIIAGMILPLYIFKEIVNGDEKDSKKKSDPNLE